MKKYCLTDCMKKKVTKCKEVVIETLTMLGVFIAVVTIGIVSFSVIGFLIEWVYYLIYGNLIGYIFGGFIEAGAMSLVFVAVISMICILVYYAIKDFIYKPINAVVTNTIYRSDNKYDGECKIFEECKNEE